MFKSLLNLGEQLQGQITNLVNESTSEDEIKNEHFLLPDHELEEGVPKYMSRTYEDVLEEKNALIEQLSLLQTKSYEQQLVEERLREDLASLNNDINVLGSSTVQLITELELSQDNTSSQSTELDVLRKLCNNKLVTESGFQHQQLVGVQEVIKALWEKYAAEVAANGKASIHCARESLHRAKKRLVSGSNEQSTRLDAERGILVHDLRELQNDIEEQHSVCEDLKGDNLQIASEAKQTLSRVGSTAAFSSPNKTKDLLEEKIVLERTIVGLESKLQELEAKNKQSDNSFVSNGSSDSIDGNAEPHEMEIILKEVESEKEALEAVVVNLRSKVKAFEKDMSFITHENVKKSDEIQLLSLELEKLKSNCENSCMDKEQHHLHTNGYTENKEVQVMSFGTDDQVIKFQKLSKDYENLSQLHKKAQQEMLNLIETREIQLNEKDNMYTQLMEEKDNMYKKWEDKEKFWNEQKEKFSQLIQENESLRQKFHDQEKLLNDKENMYAASVNENKNLCKKWEDKEKFLNQKTEKFSQLIQENESLHQKCQDQERFLSDKENMYAELVKENEHLCKKWEDKEKCWYQQTDKYSQLIQENESLHQKCQDQERFLNDKENMYAELVAEKEGAYEKCQKLEQDLIDLRELQSVSSKSLETSSISLQSLQSEASSEHDKMTLLENEIKLEKENIDKKENENQCLHKEIERLQDKCSILHSNCERLEEDREKIISENKQLRESLSETAEAKDSLSMRVGLMDKERETLQDKCSTLHSNCERLEEDREKIISENKQLRESLSETSEAKDSLSMRVGLMDKERETLQDKCSTLHSNCERLEEDREKIISVNKQLRESLSETAAAKDSLSMRVGLMDKEKEILQQSLMDSSQSNTSSIKIEELTEQNNALKSHLMNALSELEQLRELNNKSTTESFTSANQLALLQNEVDLLKENNVTLLHQMEKVQSEGVEVQSKADELVLRNTQLEGIVQLKDNEVLFRKG